MGQKSTYAMPQLFSPAESPVWWPVVPVWRSEECFVLGSVMIAAGHWSASILSLGRQWRQTQI